MFSKVIHNLDHVLHRLLPPVSPILHSYSLRPCGHDKVVHLTDCNLLSMCCFVKLHDMDLYVCDYVCFFLIFIATAF